MPMPRAFNRDFDCDKVDRTITASGSISHALADNAGGAAHRCVIRITFCTGAQWCGTALPKLSVVGDCPIADSLCS